MELPRRVTVERDGRVLGQYEILETLPQVSTMVLGQKAPGALFTASVTLANFAEHREFNNVSGYKLTRPEATEVTLFWAGALSIISFSPPRDVGVYQGQTTNRVRKTIYFLAI